DQIPGLSVYFISVRESMRNGGGPACLRLRVELTPEEQSALNPGAVLTPALYDRLRAWINRHYRESLSPADLADPSFAAECAAALADLAIIGLPTPFSSSF